METAIQAMSHSTIALWQRVNRILLSLLFFWKVISMKNYPATGFTLAELLVTVGLIGTIAAITIPSVLSGMETTNRRAIMKDTLKIVREAAESLTMQADVPESTYLAMVRGVRILERNDTTLTITLHNGATLSGFTTTPAAAFTRCESFIVDVNGAGQPNIVGQDRVGITASWAPDNSTNCGVATTIPATFTGGMVMPTLNTNAEGGAGNEAFYTELTR
jgi:type II secretory pathway pseudopilin PulG